MNIIKKILGGIMVIALSYSFSQTVFATSMCNAIPQGYRDSWSTLSVENRQDLTTQFCTQSTESTATQGSTASNVNTKLENPIKYDSFYAFVEAVINTAVKILIPFVVIGFMISGFLFIKAQGNTEELSKAKTAMWYSMLGAFILLGSLGFAQIIGRTVSTLTK